MTPPFVTSNLDESRKTQFLKIDFQEDKHDCEHVSWLMGSKLLEYSKYEHHALIPLVQKNDTTFKSLIPLVVCGNTTTIKLWYQLL